VVPSLLWPYLPFLLRPFQRWRQVPVPAEA
jgi:hypothetical protein